MLIKQTHALEGAGSGQRVNQAEALANMELVQVQTMLGLSKEQADEMYKVLVKNAYDKVDGNTPGKSKAHGVWGGDPDEKMAAVDDILDEKQKEIYQGYLNRQKELVREIMNQSQGKAK